MSQQPLGDHIMAASEVPSSHKTDENSRNLLNNPSTFSTKFLNATNNSGKKKRGFSAITRKMPMEMQDSSMQEYETYTIK